MSGAAGGSDSWIMGIDRACRTRTGARIARSAIVLAVCGAAAGWGLFGADPPHGEAWLSPTKSHRFLELHARMRANVHPGRDR